MRQDLASVEVLLGLELSIFDAVMLVRLPGHQNTFSGVSHRNPLTPDHWRGSLTLTAEHSPRLEASPGCLCPQGSPMGPEKGATNRINTDFGAVHNLARAPEIDKRCRVPHHLQDNVCYGPLYAMTSPDCPPSSAFFWRFVYPSL